MYTSVTSTWAIVRHRLEIEPQGTVLRVPKKHLPHPKDEGAYRSVGMPMGQSADFRWRLEDGRGIHARDFGTHYEVHIDAVDPSSSVIDHLRYDDPNAYVAGMAALGALFGIVFGGSKEALLAGMGLGAAAGAFTLPEANTHPRSQAS